MRKSSSYNESCAVSWSSSLLQTQGPLTGILKLTLLLSCFIQFLINSFINEAYSLQEEGEKNLGTFPWESK